MGDGGSGETETEGSGLPPGDIDFSSGEVDPSTYYPAPGYNIIPSGPPAPELSPEEFAAEQERARQWLAQLPNIINAAGRITMSAAQLAAGIQAGTIKPSTTCPSGYLVGTECVAPVQPAASASLIPGLPNSTLAMIGGGILILVLITKSGGRR
jgi:hypothetical protein